MSNFSITNKDKEVSAGARIGVGIHENISMTPPTFESLKEGNPPVIKLNFQDAEGRFHSEVVWDIDPERERENAVKYPRKHARDDEEMGYTKGEQVKPDEAVAIAYANFRTRMKHVATKFVDEQTVIEVTAGATSYEDFAKKFISMFTPEVLEEGNPLRVKFASNNQGYATLPKYPPFIENMTVGADASRLSYSDYEKQVMEQAKASAATANGEVDPTDFNPADFEEEKATF